MVRMLPQGLMQGLTLFHRVVHGLQDAGKERRAAADGQIQALQQRYARAVHGGELARESRKGGRAGTACHPERGRLYADVVHALAEQPRAQLGG